MIGTLQFLAAVDLLLAGGAMVVYLAGKITIERRQRRIILKRNG